MVYRSDFVTLHHNCELFSQNGLYHEKAQNHRTGLSQGAPQGEPGGRDRAVRQACKAPGSAQIEKSIRSVPS